MDESIRQYLLEGHTAGARYALAQPPNAAMGLAGSELGRRTGESLEFMDHREYTPGDDLRRIDWNAFARTDKLTVKLYREEICPHLDLLIDTSRSMALPGTRKLRAAAGLAGLLAAAASNAGYSHAAWTAGEGCRKVPNSGAMPAEWLLPGFDATEPLSESIERMPPVWRVRGVRALVSDLLFLADPVRVLNEVAAKAAQVIVVQLLAAEDTQPPQRGNRRLVDSETGRWQEIFIDAAAQQCYRDALARHQDNWQRACRQVGAVMTTVVAEEFVENWTLDGLLAAEVLRVA